MLFRSKIRGSEIDEKNRSGTDGEPKRSTRVPPNRVRRVTQRPALSQTPADLSSGSLSASLLPAITALPPEMPSVRPLLDAPSLLSLSPRAQAVAAELDALAKTLRDPLPFNERRARVIVWHRIGFIELESKEERPALPATARTTEAARRAKALCAQFADKTAGEPTSETINAVISDALLETNEIMQSLTGSR